MARQAFDVFAATLFQVALAQYAAQGRAVVQRQAQELDLRGWAQNTEDDRVEVVVEGEPEAVSGLLRGFPTAALVVFEVTVPWSDLGPETGRVVDFWAPPR